MGERTERLVDICVLVRDVFRAISETGITPAAPIKLKELLIPAVASRLGTPHGGKFIISAQECDWQASKIRGILLRYNARAEILYSAQLNLCWKRFVVCKELAHLLIDENNEHYTVDPISLVYRMITDVLPKYDDDLESERLAMFAAIELLIPWCLRNEFISMVIDAKTDLEIAHYFRVPQAIVGFLRRDYFELSAQANSFQ
jgi:hypothetical protein